VVPAETPVTVPDAFTVATDGLLLAQTPELKSGYLTITMPEPPLPPKLLVL
jgi:hypothetical protein